MTSRIILLAFFALSLAFVEAIIDTKCMDKHPITKEDYIGLVTDSTHIPERALCLMKCQYEEYGVLNPDKTMNIEKLQEMRKDEKMEKLVEDELRECINKIKNPINTCSDLQPYVNCILAAQKRQKEQTQKS